ncbi:hypothetical protein [Flaviaesturariibacter terrae]
MLFMLAVACNSSDKQDTPPAPDTLVAKAHDPVPVPEQATQLTALFSVMKGVDASFDPKNFPAFAEDGQLQPDTLRFDPTEFAQWKPWLLFNADSSRAIDLVSYNYSIAQKNSRPVLEGAGPDMEIAVLDNRRGTRRQLLFGGPGTLSLDAAWSDPNTVLLALAEVEGKDSSGNYRYHVVLHKYDLQADRKWTSRYPRLLSGNPADLVQRNFEK